LASHRKAAFVNLKNSFANNNTGIDIVACFEASVAVIPELAEGRPSNDAFGGLADMRKFEVFEEDLIIFVGQIDHKRGKLLVGEDNIGGSFVYL
jgi:hypothetical protein